MRSLFYQLTPELAALLAPAERAIFINACLLTVCEDVQIPEVAAHIRLMQMRVGEASGVVPDFLQLAFDVVKKETIAEDARLQVESVPVVCLR